MRFALGDRGDDGFHGQQVCNMMHHTLKNGQNHCYSNYFLFLIIFYRVKEVYQLMIEEFCE